MRLTKFTGIAAAMCLALIAGTTACGSSSGTAAGSTEALTLALGTPPVSLDPSKGGNGPTSMFQTPAYSSLLHVEGDNGTVVPALAESFNWVDNRNSQLRVTLRPDVKFADGAVLDSAAVKKSAEHFATNGSAFAYVGQAIVSVDTPDPLTVVFHLKAPDPTFPNELAETSGLGMIISPNAIDAGANLGTSTAGAGPYQLSESETVIGTTYTYVQNPNYFDESAVHYEKIVIKVIPDANTALASLQSGQVQVAYATPNGDERAKSAGLKTASFPGATAGLFLQDHGTSVPALGNADVRQAINLAIDRVSAAQVASLGTGTATAQLPVPGSLGYDADLNDVYPFDVTRAKELMARAGYADGFTLPTVVPTFLATANNLAQILASQLAEIGITMSFESVTTIGAYAAATGSGKNAATVFSTGFPLGIPSAVNVMFKPNALGNPKHEDFPSVLSAATEASALNGEEAEAQWKAINATIVREALEAPVMVEPYAYYYSDAVEGVDISKAVNPIYMTPGK